MAQIVKVIININPRNEDAFNLGISSHITKQFSNYIAEKHLFGGSIDDKDYIYVYDISSKVLNDFIKELKYYMYIFKMEYRLGIAFEDKELAQFMIGYDSYYLINTRTDL